jgi:rhodanese-related sulfurtransferase
MKRILKLSAFLLLALLISCTAKEPIEVERISPQAAFDSLISYIERNGDYVNSDFAPPMISAYELYSILDSNILIIDTRTEAEFAEAHIPLSVNVPFSQLLNYFETKIDPTSFYRIALVCNSGQTLSYAASVLWFLGYNNVYVLKWGISSWHRPVAETRWISKTSNKYSELLERKPNVMNPPGEYPGIETDEIYGYTILRERAKKIFAEGYKPFTLDADTLFEAGHNFYIVNYWSEDYYNKGHIPGAIQYQPLESLGRKGQLNTLPTDKPIVVYCTSGQLSSYLVGYLRLIGYDAYNLSFGTNGFMQGVMRDEGIHTVFTEKEILDLPVSSGGVTSKVKEVEIIATQPRGGC